SSTGQITCAACDCSASAAGATEIDCPQGVVSPGLINPHDHIEFIAPPGTDSGERYENRNQWRIPLDGHTKQSNYRYDAGDKIKWYELTMVMGGAPSIVAEGSQSGFLRNLDHMSLEEDALVKPQVSYATFPLHNQSGTNLTSGCAYPTIDSATSIAAE